jgi:hypothetical protein
MCVDRDLAPPPGDRSSLRMQGGRRRRNGVGGDRDRPRSSTAWPGSARPEEALVLLPAPDEVKNGTDHAAPIHRSPGRLGC